MLVHEGWVYVMRVPLESQRNLIRDIDWPTLFLHSVTKVSFVKVNTIIKVHRPELHRFNPAPLKAMFNNYFTILVILSCGQLIFTRTNGHW